VRVADAYNGRELVDGYWGNIGLKTGGCDHSSWFPISDSDFDEIRNSPDEALALICMGGSSLIMFPANIRQTTFVSEADDQIDDDWEISSFDPVCGLPPVIPYVLAEFGMNMEQFDRHEAFLPEATGDRTSTELAKLMSDAVNEMGGEDAVLHFITTVEIMFTDGTSTHVYVAPEDKSIRWLFSRVLTEGATDTVIHIGTEIRMQFSTRDIAWIRIPASHTQGYVEIEV
jgi:hypothetical protein